MSANVTSAANVPALASAVVGPFALLAQEVRRAEGIVAALTTSLRALQVDPLWIVYHSSLVAGFARSAAAKVIALLLPHGCDNFAAHFVVFRALMPIHLFTVCTPAGGGAVAAQVWHWGHSVSPRCGGGLCAGAVF